jgi:hypothetical protein
MHPRRSPAKQVVDITLAVRHHDDRAGLREPFARDLRALQPAVRLLLVRRTAAPIRNLAFGEVQHHAIDQADHPAMGGVPRQHRMQEQSGGCPIWPDAVASISCAREGRDFGAQLYSSCGTRLAGGVVTYGAGSDFNASRCVQ